MQQAGWRSLRNPSRRPARVERIKGFLEDVKEIAFNREHKSVSGIYKGVRVMAVSTGMGGASTGIAVEELHHIGVKNMIRIGSCGALQRDIHMGDLLLIHGLSGMTALPDPM